MVWWDDRPALVAPGGAGGGGVIGAASAAPLHASVDLDDEYLRQLVTDAFRRRVPAWRVTSQTGHDENVTPDALVSDLHWGEYERMDWSRIHEGDQAASAYCMRKGLIRKAHLAHNVKKWAAKHPAGVLAAAVPETFILSVDDEEYIDEALCDLPEVRDMEPGSAVWIAKPSITNQGAGIAVFDSCAGLRSVLEGAPDLREWVVQRYIADPLLLGGRKFHLRAYVLCVGKLRVYVYSEMLALFAGEMYDSGDLSNLAAHLTNTCRQAGVGASPANANGGNESSGGGSGGGGGDSWREEDVVKLLSELPEALVAEGMQLAEAQRHVADAQLQACAVIGECLEAVSHELTFFPLPGCFELFGFDLMLDADWRVWLLEANAEPDFGQTGRRLKGLVAGIVEATLQLVADPLVAERGPLPAAEGSKAGHGSVLAATALTAAAAASASDDSGSSSSRGGQETSDSNVAESLVAAQFVKVYSSRASGALQGPSGIRMQ